MNIEKLSTYNIIRADSKKTVERTRPTLYLALKPVAWMSFTDVQFTVISLL